VDPPPPPWPLRNATAGSLPGGIEKLVRYGVAIGIASVAKRLGFSLERAGVDAARLAPLRAVPARGVLVLDPTRGKTGHRVASWSLVDNLTPV